MNRRSNLNLELTPTAIYMLYLMVSGIIKPSILMNIGFRHRGFMHSRDQSLITIFLCAPPPPQHMVKVFTSPLLETFCTPFNMAKTSSSCVESTTKRVVPPPPLAWLKPVPPPPSFCRVKLHLLSPPPLPFCSTLPIN